jgi:hypothetical protein
MSAVQQEENNISHAENLQALRDFLLDEQCLKELAPWISNVNLFDVLKSSTHELKHSNVLAWLLDPSENHGTGDFFLKALFQHLFELHAIKWDKSPKEYFSCILNNFSNFSIYREWEHIDILIVSKEEKIVIAIENKIKSIEHGQQLQRYRKLLEETYPDCQRFYIFLTLPEANAPSDTLWQHWTYDWVTETIEEMASRFPNMNETVKTLTFNYLNTLRRTVMNDSQLEEICNDIYNKHKKALDLIYDTCVTNKDPNRDILEAVLKEYEKEGKLTTLRKGGYAKPAFHTPEMNDFLGKRNIELNGVGSWGTDANYYFFFERKNHEKPRLVLELGTLDGLKETPSEKMIQLAKVTAKKRESKEKWEKFHRIWSSAPFPGKGDIREWARKILDDILSKKQEEWLGETKRKMKSSRI